MPAYLVAGSTLSKHATSLASSYQATTLAASPKSSAMSDGVPCSGSFGMMLYYPLTAWRGAKSSRRGASTRQTLLYFRRQCLDCLRSCVDGRTSRGGMRVFVLLKRLD